MASGDARAAEGKARELAMPDGQARGRPGEWHPSYAPEVQDAMDVVIAYHPDWPTVQGGCSAWIGVDETIASALVLE